MVKLVNRAKMKVASGGAGTLTLGTACDGYQTFAAGGVADQNKLRYTITDGNDWEIGVGTYTASGTTLARAPTESSNSGNAITCGSGAEIFVTMAAEDFAGNLAPIWLTTPVSEAYLASDGSAITLTGLAIDDGGYPVVYSWDGYSGTSIYSDSSLPPQLASAPTFSGGTASLIGSSSATNAGTFNFRLLASDGINSAATTTALTLEFPFVITGSQSQLTGNLLIQSGQANPRDLAISPDGTKLFVVGDNNDRVAQFTLSTAFDLTSGSYDSVYFDTTAKETNPRATKFSNDGLKMFVAGFASDKVHQYSLSSAFDLSSTPTFVYSLTPSASNNPDAMCFNEDGSRFFLLQGGNDTIYQYNLSTAFDLSTAVYSNLSFYTGSQTTTPTAIVFNNNGSKMFVSTSSKVFQYSTAVTSPWSLSGLSYDSVSLTTGGYTTGMVIKPDQSSLFVLNLIADRVYQYG